MATQQTKHEAKEVRQERAADFWQQRIATGQTAQHQTAETKQVDKPKQVQP